MVKEQQRVDIKKAVRLALDYVRELYSDERILDLGLEEVKSTDDTWIVTVGFSRPWNRRKEIVDLPFVNAVDRLRDYRTVTIDAGSGAFKSMEIRAL